MKSCSIQTISSSSASAVTWRTSSPCASSSVLASCLRCWQGIKQRNSGLNWSPRKWHNILADEALCLSRRDGLPFEQEVTVSGGFHFLSSINQQKGGFIFTSSLWDTERSSCPYFLGNFLKSHEPLWILLSGKKERQKENDYNVFR